MPVRVESHGKDLCPLREEFGICYYRVGCEVPRVVARGFLIPTVEAVGSAALCHSGGAARETGRRSRFLTGFNRLVRGSGTMVLHIEGHSIGVSDVVVVAAHVGVRFSRVFSAYTELLPGRIGLTIGVVGLKDRVGAVVRVALEVTAGDQRRVRGGGAVIFIGVGGGFRRLIQTAGDFGNLRIRLIIDGVIACRSAVSVNLRTLADLADGRELTG